MTKSLLLNLPNELLAVIVHYAVLLGKKSRVGTSPYAEADSRY